MKKTVSLFVVLFTFITLFSFCASAQDIDFDTLGEDVGNELFSAIDGDIADILEEMGITSGEFSEIYNFSFSNISNFFKSTLKDKAIKCFQDFFRLLSVVMLISVVASLFKGSGSNSLISLMGVVIVTLLMVNIVKGSLSAVVSVIKLSSGFMLSFVPVYTLVISLSGNAASALTYNTLVMIFAEGLSSLISYGFVDIIGLFFCLAISFSMNESINLSRFIGAVNKTVSLVLGLSASVFTGFLSIRNVLSVAVDSVSVKGIRFLISSLIPIVGSSISDAYSSLVGSINLIKGSVAVIGILVIIIINLPIILETLIYYILFSVLSYVADSVSNTRLGDTLRCFSCGIRILLLLCVFEMFILIISTGIMLSLKGGM